MSEAKYHSVPSPFPILARGLFSREIPVESQEGEPAKKYHQIVVRGYDKFFNIAEVPWTKWQSLEAHTVAPYTLSLKSSGSLIMIAALTPSKIIVTSKLSLGGSSKSVVTHAQAGEAWLRKHLENKGKTEEELAARLWESNLTAVAELCDDSYEEHVLAHSPEKTGLHLHGLNVRSKEFKTLSTDLVDAFADEFGFIKTPTIVLNSIQEVRDFTDACAKTGEWNGEAIEGFVVRTHLAELPTSETGTGTDLTLPPYNSGSPLFFKVKFDGPYMMYLNWQDITMILLASETELKTSIIPRSKMQRAENKAYAKWVIKEIIKDRSQFADFPQRKGIIATRERFLEFLKTEQGMEELEHAKNEKDVSGTAKKAIIVPVGIPGCGKTSVSVALAHIFGFGHIQSDDRYGKFAGFVKNVFQLLREKDVVIADKTNHLKQYRRSLQDATSRFPDPVRFIALNWSLKQPSDTILRICSDRIEERGDKHQNLRADPSNKSHEDVIKLHISSTEELAPGEVNNVVEMELGESLEESVKRAVEGCVAALGLEMPSDEKIQEGLEIAKSYVPAERKSVEAKERKSEVRYYRLLPEVDLVTLLDKAFAEEDVSNKAFWTQLKSDDRVQNQPQTAIVHKDDIDANGDLWNRCAALHGMSIPPLFKATLSHVLWDGRIMVIPLENFDHAAGDEGREFVSNLSDDVRSRLYIMVGAKDMNVQATSEAKMLVETWRKGEQLENIKSIKLPEDLSVLARMDQVKVRERRRRGGELRYYTLLPDVNLEALLDGTFADQVKSAVDFWTQLKTDKRVQNRPHATITHIHSIDTERDLWDRCAALDEKSTMGITPLFQARLGHVLWDGRIMMITLDDFDVAGASSASNGEFVSNLSDDVRSRMFILVGTKDGQVQPPEAKAMIQKWRKGEDLDRIKSIKLADDLVVYGKIRGQRFGFSG